MHLKDSHQRGKIGVRTPKWSTSDTSKFVPVTETPTTGRTKAAQVRGKEAAVVVATPMPGEVTKAAGRATAKVVEATGAATGVGVAEAEEVTIVVEGCPAAGGAVSTTRTPMGLLIRKVLLRSQLPPVVNPRPVVAESEWAQFALWRMYWRDSR